MYRNQEQRDFARSLRNQQTPAEQRLWRILRAEQVGGFKFRRQAAIRPYIVDFACFSAKVIVELDGPQHGREPASEHDRNRDAWLQSRGFTVLRFRNHQIDDGLHEIGDCILQVLRRHGAATDVSPLPNPPRRGEGAGTDQDAKGQSR